MERFFIGDMHLGHKNCLGFDNRPFSTIEQHDNALIKNWNDVVGDRDEVYILGDFSFHNKKRTMEILDKLKGNKYLIKGNHDYKSLDRHVREKFVECIDYKELKMRSEFIDGKISLVLSHYPMPCFNRHHYGAWHFYAHVHSSFEENMMQSVRNQMKELYDKPCNMVNVGAMMPWIDYTPRTFDWIINQEYASEVGCPGELNISLSNLCDDTGQYDCIKCKKQLVKK